MSLIKNPGRRAGLLYLLLMTAPLRLIYIPAKLFVAGDAAVTANNIATHETLLAVWLIVNGASYITLSLADFLLPQYSVTVSKIIFPALLGELVLMLWLIIRGVKMEKWKALPQPAG